MNYEKYKNARNCAWQLLIDNKITQLPVKISNICQNLGIKIIPYSLWNIDNAKNDGYTRYVGDELCIFYDDKCSPQRCRFTIAHELGHIILGHVKKGFKTKVNREPSITDDPLETQANLVAIRILSPACVLWALHINSADDIARICDISLQSATFRLERLKLLYKREQDFIRKYNKSCFLMSDLEKKVYNQFKPFINQFFQQR